MRNKQELIEKFAPLTCLKIFSNVNTIEKAIENKTNSLSIYRKFFGDDAILSYIEIWILTTNKFLNLKNIMNEAQIKITAQMILNDFYNLTITDVYLIFSKAFRGEYGEMYSAIDGMKIYSWFKNYFDQRCQICYDNSIKEHEMLRYQESKDEIKSGYLKDIYKQKKI